MTDPTFQTYLRDRLSRDIPDRAEALNGAYASALAYLEANVYEEIRAREPHLTDHGPRHVANVQRNVLALLSEDDNISLPISAVELYCLAIATLFHDVGNMEGREGHHQNVGAIFDAARGTSSAVRREKTLVLRACAAHTGVASTGSRDTLLELPEIEQFEGHKVRHRQLAAILRFADELAEGPQRTSDFRLSKGAYAASSRVYQEYASVTHVLIDRGNRRIALAYEIAVDAEHETEDARRASLTALISHIAARITKLDQERRYAVHYSSLLSAFQATEASSLQIDHPISSPEDLAVTLIRRCNDTKVGA